MLCGCVSGTFCSCVHGCEVCCVDGAHNSGVGWGMLCVCVNTATGDTLTLGQARRGGGGVGNRRLTGADKNVPVWQGPLGYPPSRYPGRNPACQGWPLPLPQHRTALNEATTSPSPGMGLASLTGQG